jgi:hypothetical protein
MKQMRVWFVLCVAVLSAGALRAQGGPQPVLPPLIECGLHGEIEILCGTKSPEDLELTPDGKFLIATQFLNQGRGGLGGGMAIFELSKKTFRKMAITSEPDKSWGDAACPGPIGEALLSHGSSLAKRKGGGWALYVVNHGGRESIEMFELRKASTGWTLVWHGCEVAIHDYNDLAILPDGGFVGSYPSGLSAGNGYVARWTPGKGEAEVPGTRMRGPNGVSASADGRYMYVNEFPARTVHKFDLIQGKEVGSVKLDFLPDNLTWTKQGHLLAAGVKGARGDCPAGSGKPCIQGFGVAEIDPATMLARTVFDSATSPPLISSVSVALRVDNAVYIGAFQGDRLVKIPYKK